MYMLKDTEKADVNLCFTTSANLPMYSPTID